MAPLMKPVLPIQTAKTAMAAALAAAVTDGLSVAVAIVDDGGHLLCFERMDGVPWGSGEVALAKAVSAAAYRRDTLVFDERLTSGRMATLSQPQAFPIQGGVALTIDGQCVGGIGISGALAVQDTTLCKAAARVLVGAGGERGDA